MSKSQIALKMEEISAEQLISHQCVVWNIVSYVNGMINQCIALKAEVVTIAIEEIGL